MLPDSLTLISDCPSPFSSPLWPSVSVYIWVSDCFHLCVHSWHPIPVFSGFSPFWTIYIFVCRHPCCLFPFRTIVEKMASERVTLILQRGEWKSFEQSGPAANAGVRQHHFTLCWRPTGQWVLQVSPFWLALKTQAYVMISVGLTGRPAVLQHGTKTLTLQFFSQTP